MEEGPKGTKERKMTMTEWARNEIERAIEKNNDDDYGNACRRSALKAFESLMGDNHSGFSFEVTKQILERLMKDLPLAPITSKNDFDKQGQCKRMFSLFMHGKKGHETFTDNRRAMCIDESGGYYASDITTEVADTLWPIKLPYWPTLRKYEFKVKKGKIESVTTPDGECYGAAELAMMFAGDKWLKGAKAAPDLATVKAELEGMFDVSVNYAKKVDLHADGSESEDAVCLISIDGPLGPRIEILERDGKLIDYDTKKGVKGIW